MQTLRLLGSIATVSILLFASSIGSAQPTGGTVRTFELRIYTANAGRLADFQSLFRRYALPLFAKYGIENVFEGSVLEGAPVDARESGNMLVCVLAHSGRETADRSWAALERDSTWQLALQDAERNGPLLAKTAVSILMTPTDFSPTLEPPTTAGSGTRVFELRKYNTGAEGLPRTLEQFKSGLAAILSKNGMTPIGFWTTDDHSAFIYLLAHKDREAARASWSSFMGDYRPFMKEFNERVPAPTGRRAPDDNRFLAPTSYSPRR